MYRIIGYNEPTDKNGFIVLDQRVNRTVSEGKLTIKETDIDDLELTVNRDNLLFDNVRPMHTHVEVYDDDKLLFRGRAIKPKKEMQSSGRFIRTYTFEDIEAYLLDSVQRFYEAVGLTPKEFLQSLIDVHNSQVPQYKQFKLRNCNVTNNKDDAYRQIDYPKTRDAIKDKLINELGGYLVTEYKQDGPNMLDYVTDIGNDHKNDTPIQLAVNMQSASLTIDPTKVITRVIPLGKQLDSQTVDVSGENSTVTTGGGATTAINGDWTEAIKHAAKMMNVNLDQNGLNAVLRRINQESGGSETVTNNWDSNARAGHPSTGLLQYIQSTFDTWKVQGYEDIHKGFHQLLALFNDSNWLADISVAGGWSPTGTRRVNGPVSDTTTETLTNGWGWPFPDVGEGSFSQAQRFGYDGGYRTNSFHDGLDFGSVDHPGSDVHAIHGGTVVFKGYMGGLGNYVVTHSTDGFNIVYQEAFGSASQIRVNIGDKVKTGDVIGWRNTDHLHVGVTKADFYEAVKKSFTNDGTWLDPQALIKNGGDGSQSEDESKKEEVSNSNAARPKLTITSVNEGRDYIDIPDLQKEFGIINGTIEFNEVTDANDLMNQAKAWIDAQRVPESWEVSAVELNLPNFDHFKVADRYMFVNPYVAQSQLLRVVQKEVDLLQPHKSTLTIGDKSLGLTDYQLETSRQAQDLERVKVIVSRVAEIQASGQADTSSTTTIVQSGASSQDVTQLKFDMQQLQKIINDKIPAGYVSQADFIALKAEVDKLKGAN
ncbi:phage tail protein [Limosilactobacillus mucosae]|uniref:phage tail protein n=1 Tax=Limosilactobacillus mucosae TaxID=97478 RepID=UPI00233E5E08|nr:phage tail protein [Limosilactobacillus mucosae]MDC2841597.1 phage tail protein [Limosilactobacillus mucosae]